MSLNKGTIKIRSPLNYSLAQALILVIPQPSALHGTPISALPRANKNKQLLSVMALPKFVAGSNFKLKIMQNFSSKCMHLYGPSPSNIYTNSTPVSQYFMPIYPTAMCSLFLNDSLWNMVPGSALKKHSILVG
jgi:hypothetical protein